MLPVLFDQPQENSKDIQFIMIWNEEKQQILTVENPLSDEGGAIFCDIEEMNLFYLYPSERNSPTVVWILSPNIFIA